MLRKIKILILDDEPMSLDAIIACALPSEGPLYQNQVIDTIKDLIDINSFNTVSDAIHWLKSNSRQNKPDLVFTDLRINTEEDPEINRLEYQGLYFIKWLREQYGNDLPIKVHTRYDDVDEIEQSLEASKIGLSSFFALLPREDMVHPSKKLNRNFPVLLQEVARTHVLRLMENADKRSQIRESVEIHLSVSELDKPIPALGYFSLQTLMAGWLAIRLKNDEPELFWTLTPDQAWKALHNRRNTAAEHEKGTSVIRRKLEDFRKRSDYESLREVFEKEALEIIQEFTEKWKDFDPDEQQSYDSLYLHSIFLQDANRNLTLIESDKLGSDQEIQVLTRTFRMRLVLGGICTLRQKFKPSFQKKIVDFAILGCIRNSVREVRAHLRQPNTQVKKYLFYFGLGKERLPNETGQQLRKENFFLEELRWFNSLEEVVLH